MFKLKPGNVFQKINSMDRKQAYTWGAVVVVAFIALLTLASYLGGADDSSMEGFDAQGYDLAQLPFVNDEAEAYLLSSKYPDMQNNQSSLFYSPQEKEERQEADAEAQGDREADIDISGRVGSGDSKADEGGSSSRRGGRVTPRGGGGGSATSIGQLGSAGGSAKASGSGLNSTWGSSPRGDFRPFSDQDKGAGGVASLQNQDAKKALSQFARGSSAAARLRDNKGANAKRAMMGGNIMGGEAFGDNGVDLSKLGDLVLDTNAPVPTSPDLSDLTDKVTDAANKNKPKDDDKNKDDLSFWEKLGQRFLEGMVDKLVEGLGNAMNRGLDSLFTAGAKNKASRQYGNDFISKMGAVDKGACRQDRQCMQNFTSMLGKENAYNYLRGDSDLSTFMKDNKLTNSDVRRNMKANGGSISTTTDDNGMFIGVTDPRASTYSSGRQDARRSASSSSSSYDTDDVERYNQGVRERNRQVEEYNRRLDEEERRRQQQQQPPASSSGGCSVVYSCELDQTWNSRTCSCEYTLYVM